MRGGLERELHVAPGYDLPLEHHADRLLAEPARPSVWQEARGVETRAPGDRPFVDEHVVRERLGATYGPDGVQDTKDGQRVLVLHQGVAPRLHGVHLLEGAPHGAQRHDKLRGLHALVERPVHVRAEDAGQRILWDSARQLLLVGLAPVA